MSRMMPNGGARTLANPLPSDLDGLRAGKANLRIDAKNVDNAQELKPLRTVVREAMRATGISQKEFAINAGQTESVISEALSGGRALSIEWVWAQPDALWSEFSRRANAERGLSPDRETEVDEEQILAVVAALLRRTRRKAVNK